MHEFDVAMKLTLRQVDYLIRELIGTTISSWHNVELPEVRNTRVDLLGETAAGELVHIELQATNDADMPLRMAEYYLRVFRQFNKFPRQVLLYVGEEPLRMSAELNGPALKFAYRLIDVRELDGQQLLASPYIGDNIIAVLTRLPDPAAALSRVLERIGALPPGERQAAFNQLRLLAGLRKPVYEVMKQEAKRMPITIDIREHPMVIEGYERGLQQGVQEGVQQGERNLLQRQIRRKFGPLPHWAEDRLNGLTVAQLEDLSDRVLEAESLEALFQ
jgi:hypothetical protein